MTELATSGRFTNTNTHEKYKMTHHVAQAVKHAGAMLQGRRNMWVDVSPTMTQKFSREFQEVLTQNLLEFPRIQFPMCCAFPTVESSFT